jgi:hypothetical protein
MTSSETTLLETIFSIVPGSRFRMLVLMLLDRRRDDLCVAECHERAFVVSSRNRAQDSKTPHFLGCEAFSLTSQKDANGHQKGQAGFVGGYLSLLEPHWQFYSGFLRSGFTTTSRIE